MIATIRLFALGLLSLTLALTSVTGAVARSAAQGQYSVTICGIDGVVQITLDAQGNPVAPMHPCPDCALTLVAALPESAGAPGPAVAITRLAPVPPVPAILPARVPPALARGPPRSV